MVGVGPGREQFVRTPMEPLRPAGGGSDDGHDDDEWDEGDWQVGPGILMI